MRPSIISSSKRYNGERTSNIDHLKTITIQHQVELEKAIIGQGERHFCSEYAYLQVSESVWFSSMKSEAKDKHLKVQTCQLKQPPPSATAESQIASTGADCGDTRLSVSVETRLSKVSQSTLEGIWKKVETLNSFRREYLESSMDF